LSVPTNPSSDITPFTRNSEAPPSTELLLNYVNETVLIYLLYYCIDSEMAGRHKAQRESLVIIRTTEIKGDVAENAKRTYSTQVAKEGIKFPLLQRKLRPYRKAFKTVFKATRPNLFA